MKRRSYAVQKKCYAGRRRPCTLGYRHRLEGVQIRHPILGALRIRPPLLPVREKRPGDEGAAPGQGDRIRR